MKNVAGYDVSRLMVGAFGTLGVILAVVFMNEGQRRIPIQYAKRQVGRRMMSGGSTYLPLRVNIASLPGVIFLFGVFAFLEAVFRPIRAAVTFVLVTDTPTQPPVADRRPAEHPHPQVHAPVGHRRGLRARARA